MKGDNKGGIFKNNTENEKAEAALSPVPGHTHCCSMAGIKQSQWLTLTSPDYLIFSAFISQEEPVVVRPTGSALSLQPRWEARPVL